MAKGFDTNMKLFFEYIYIEVYCKIVALLHITGRDVQSHMFGLTSR